MRGGGKGNLDPCWAPHNTVQTAKKRCMTTVCHSKREPSKPRHPPSMHHGPAQAGLDATDKNRKNTTTLVALGGRIGDSCRYTCVARPVQTLVPPCSLASPIPLCSPEGRRMGCVQVAQGAGYYGLAQWPGAHQVIVGMLTIRICSPHTSMHSYLVCGDPHIAAVAHAQWRAIARVIFAPIPPSAGTRHSAESATTSMPSRVDRIKRRRWFHVSDLRRV